MKLLWTVLLLALVPLTMAPRTATEPAPVEGLKVELSRPSGGVAPGAAVPLHITLTNLNPSADGILHVSTSGGEARIVSVSSGCRASAGTVRCPYDLDEGESVRFKVTLRLMAAGEYRVRVSTDEGTPLASDLIRVTRSRG